MTTFFLRNIDGISYGAIVRGDTSIPELDGTPEDR